MTKQPFRVTPGSTPGKWSLLLAIAMPLLFLIGSFFTNSLYRSVPAGETIGADLTSRPALALTMLTGMAAGVSAFFIGLLAILRQKDYAILVYAATAIGALLVIFLAGEVVLPH